MQIMLSLSNEACILINYHYYTNALSLLTEVRIKCAFEEQIYHLLCTINLCMFPAKQVVNVDVIGCVCGAIYPH